MCGVAHFLPKLFFYSGDLECPYQALNLKKEDGRMKTTNWSLTSRLSRLFNLTSFTKYIGKFKHDVIYHGLRPFRSLQKTFSSLNEIEDELHFTLDCEL